MLDRDVAEARWAKAGVEVRIVRTKVAGTDWNDVLKGVGR